MMLVGICGFVIRTKEVVSLRVHSVALERPPFLPLFLGATSLLC